DEIGDYQDLGADLFQAALVNTAGAHPETALVFSSADVPIAEPADVEHLLKVPEIPLGEVIVNRERRRQKIELVQLLARPRDRGRNFIAIPQLRLEIRDKFVLDNQIGSRQRRQPFD